MTSREIMKAVLDFAGPERIGLTLPDPYPNDMMDGGWRGATSEPCEPRGNELRRWRDEWGVTWASLTDYDKGEVVEGAIGDWAALDDYRPPDMGRPTDYADAAAAFADDTERFRVGQMPGFVFNIARKLRKLDHYLCDLVLEPAPVARLNALVEGELLKAIDCWAHAGADAIMFPEDWGTQDRLMIAPAMWREIFKPHFQTLAGRGRDHGLYVIMHSCGKTTDIIGDLIECGIHCLQFDQPRLHGIDTLADRFGGKVTFWCPVDIQTTLQTRDAAKIRDEARLLVDRLGADGGGFVGGYYWGNEAIGLTPDVQDVACRAFLEFGRYG